MSANIDTSNGRINFAYIGDSAAVWWNPPAANRLPDGCSDQEILRGAGLEHTYSKRTAYAHDKTGSLVPVPGQYFIARDDNDFVTSGSVSDQYNIVQPKTLQQGFSGYIAVDPNFRWSAAGSLDLGRQVFFCAEYNGDVTIAGDKHKAYLQAHTSFDTSAASSTSISLVRSVCQNTVRAALASAAAIVRRVHRTTFDPTVVTKELAKLVASIDKYKHIGDAMITVHQTQDEVAAYFRKLLDVPADAKATDISTRKLNQLDTLWNAYETTCGETDKGTAWAAFQAVTRYVDHNRGTRSADAIPESEARFLSAQFGSGAAMKQEAWNLLMPLVKPLVAVAA